MSFERLPDRRHNVRLLYSQFSFPVQNEQFFSIGPHEKLAIAHPPGPSPQRGWSCVGAEKTSRLFSRGKASIDLTDARVRDTSYFICVQLVGVLSLANGEHRSILTPAPPVTPNGPRVGPTRPYSRGSRPLWKTFTSNPIKLPCSFYKL